jgi:hypothetical protein
VTQLFWAKADAGQYYLRPRRGGLGPAVGRVWKADVGPHSGSFYHATYDTPEAYINFTERGQPKTVMAMLEKHITARFPDTTFTKEF